jgi:hypothetical protein
MSVIFAVDLAEDMGVGNKVLSFSPSNDTARKFNVYESYLGAYPESGYWLDWGGYYDNPVANQIEMYIGGRYLIRVRSLADCRIQEFSIYDETVAGTVYINVPVHPWLYDDVKTNPKKIVSFLSAPKNTGNPSDDVFNNEHWPVRLEVPKLTVKLSDVISGLIKYSAFDFTLHNNDGHFDDLEVTNFFNSPSYIRKTWKENPKVEDFITIRYGMAESIKVNDKSMTVSCADLFRTLEEPVSKAVKDLFTQAVKNTDENLPVVYGTVTIPLIETGTLQYAAGENITAVSSVYDKDGNTVGFNFDKASGIITAASEAKYAVVTGNTNNKTGQIIVDVMKEKAGIAYLASFWDLTETNAYINNSPVINIAFTGGTVRDAIKNALMSDTVFLIQKNDGRFTLRQWGGAYNQFTVKSWEITRFPEKDYADAQRGYFSSCVIQYGYNFYDKTYAGVLLYRDNEDDAEARYHKLVRKEFKTYLSGETAARSLAAKLSGRFSVLRETVQVGLGHDTSGINLLDTVRLELNVNGREFSKYTEWIVKEIDPAQDILTLEPVIS